MTILIAITTAAFLAAVWVFKTFYMPPEGGEVVVDYTESTASNLPPPISQPTTTLLFDTPAHAYHSTRVICDEMGLTYEQKNEICATIYGESEFNNKAVCRNRKADGTISSSDWGICQWNDYWHCGEGKTFPSAEYVVANPEIAVRTMVKFYKRGQIDLWVAHKTGRYLQFLKPTSPMWTLA